MTITIKPIQVGDEENWRELWKKYLDFYETSVPDEVYDISFSRLLSTNDNEFSGIMAFQDGEAVGLCHYLFHRHLWKIENVCYLQDLYVSNSTRGEGVGRKLIEKTYELADQAGAPTVYWLTQDYNKTARLLYDRISTKTPFIKYQRPL